GATGATGAAGATGATGASGSNGLDGAAGATGATGATGQGYTVVGPYVSGTAYTAYQVVTENGSSYVALAASTTEDPATSVAANDGAWQLQALAGANGATGTAGGAGANGATGATGAAGATGATGASGSNGLDGAAGATGATGQGYTVVGPYVSGTAYTAYQVVTENGSSYVALAAKNTE